MEPNSAPRRARSAVAVAAAAAAVLLAGCSTAAAAYQHVRVEVSSSPANSRPKTLPHSPTVATPATSPATRPKPKKPAPTVPVGTTAPTSTTTPPVPTTQYAPCTASAHPVDAGPVTVIGDSVTMDFEPCLADDIRDVNFEAFVGQQWDQGVSNVGELRADGRLGSTVVIALGTNGPVTSSDFAAMMSALHGVAKIVFVTDYVNESWTDWQASNNAVIEDGAARYGNVTVANWCALAEANPKWFTPNGGPHVAIGGAAAAAAAELIASKL